MKNPFKNKHILAAVIVTPILALISFFATDYFVSEKPHAALEGESYKLVGRPNCRYTSGVCTLKNGDFLLDIAFTNNAVTVDSKFQLNGVKVGINDGQPLELSPSNDQENLWQTPISEKPKADGTFKLVVESQNTLYFAEHDLGFVNKETLTDQNEVSY